jgi:hypothetical protein
MRQGHCALCGRTKQDAFRVGTRLQAHHGIPKSLLRRRGLEEHVWRTELAVALCEEPCHRRVTDGRAKFYRHWLPPTLFRIVAELELEEELERQLLA